MPNKTKCSASRKAYYALSVDISAKNASKRLIKHLKHHPKDLQSVNHDIPKFPHLLKGKK